MKMSSDQKERKEIGDTQIKIGGKTIKNLRKNHGNLKTTKKQTKIIKKIGSWTLMVSMALLTMYKKHYGCREQ